MVVYLCMFCSITACLPDTVQPRCRLTTIMHTDRKRKITTVRLLSVVLLFIPLLPPSTPFACLFSYIFFVVYLLSCKIFSGEQRRREDDLCSHSKPIQWKGSREMDETGKYDINKENYMIVSENRNCLKSVNCVDCNCNLS